MHDSRHGLAMLFRLLGVQKRLEEDLTQKRKQVLTLKQSIDKQSSAHVRCCIQDNLLLHGTHQLFRSQALPAKVDQLQCSNKNSFLLPCVCPLLQPLSFSIRLSSLHCLRGNALTCCGKLATNKAKSWRVSTHKAAHHALCQLWEKLRTNSCQGQTGFSKLQRCSTLLRARSKSVYACCRS